MVMLPVLLTVSVELLAAAGALALSPGCMATPTTSTSRPSGEKRVVTVTHEQRDQKIKLRVGEQLRVELPSYLSRGQAWRLTNKDNLQTVKLKEGYPKYEKQTGKPGGSEAAVFLFDVEKAGVDELEAETGRPGKPAQDRFRITIEASAP